MCLTPITPPQNPQLNGVLCLFMYDALIPFLLCQIKEKLCSNIVLTLVNDQFL